MNTGTRLFAVALSVPLVAAYGYRTVTGFVSGFGYARGRVEVRLGNYVAAVEQLERGAAGIMRLPALRIAAATRIDHWDRIVSQQGPLTGDEDLARDAGRLFLECLCEAPASRWSREGLGEAYDGLEWVGRERQALQPLVAVPDPWERVGRPGRVAIGMMRHGIEFAPSWFRLHDKLALTLWAYGLEDEARQAVRDSARAYPLYGSHAYRLISEVPDWVPAEFAKASRESVGKVGFVSRAVHLIDLGKLERRIGNVDAAVVSLREALSGRLDDLQRADATFYLALALGDRGEEQESLELLRQAGEHPVFRTSSLINLAAAAERRGELRAALDYLRQLRWEERSNLQYTLQYARMARRLEEWASSVEALTWARQEHPSETVPLVELIETYIAKGEPSSARAILRELEAREGSEPEVRRLERRLADSR